MSDTPQAHANLMELSNAIAVNSLTLQMRMNKLPWILLMFPLLFITTDARYTQAEVSDIVRGLAMKFRTFPRPGERQYAVLLVLPAEHYMVLDPPQRSVENFNGDVLLGNNYAVSRTHFGSHTEPQLLHHLSLLLSKYRTAYGMDPPAVLLYTRGTPCSVCTNVIAAARHGLFTGRAKQFVVAYSTNMVNRYMTPRINCENRNLLRMHNYTDVYCVQETPNQCREDDSRPCDQHNVLYGWRRG